MSDIPITMHELFWGYFSRMERSSLITFVKTVAPEPHGCYEGKNGKISRCCTGYGAHHFLLEWYKRYRLNLTDQERTAVQAWLIASVQHYCEAHDAIMLAERHPPGEYVDVPHSKDDDYDIFRHNNPSGIFRIACDPELGVLLHQETRNRIRRVGVETGNWLFSANWWRQRNWHIRHHYPIQTAVWLYHLLGDPAYIHGACWLLKAFWSDPRKVVGPDGRWFLSYDIGRPNDDPPPRLGWGSSQLTFFAWYNGLICEALFDLYMAHITPKWARDLCKEIVVNITDWYLLRESCPVGELRKGQDLLINSPLQGGMRYVEGETDQPYLTTDTKAHVISDEEWDDLPNDEKYWPYLFMKATEVRPSDLKGDYYEATIDGQTRYHHPRRFAGGPGKSGILGAQLELSGPGKSVVNALGIRAAIEWGRNPGLARRALLRAKRILVDQFFFMNQSMAPYSKSQGLGVMRHVETGIWDTAAGNNRMPYWTANCYRILRALEENGWFDVGKFAPSDEDEGLDV